MKTTETVSLRLPSQTRYLGLIGASAVEICRLWEESSHMETGSDPEQTAYDLQLAVNEAAVNAIEHGYGGRGDGVVEVRFHLHTDQLVVDVVDWGAPFEFDGVVDPDLSQPLESGYGLFLMRRLMDEVSYSPDPSQGNQLRLVKRLSEEKPV